MNIVVKDRDNNIICNSNNIGFVSISLEDGEIARYENGNGGVLLNNIHSAYFYDFRKKD